MTAHEIFSANLSKIVRRRGITQTEIAQKMGVSTATVSGWMNGTKVPRMNKFNALCEFLGVDISTLTTENGFELYDRQSRQAQMKKVPLLGSVAAGEPINDAEFPDTYVYSPVDCDFALRVRGDSMQPTYLEGDVVYCRSCRALPHDGAIVVLSIGVGECVEHCIKHVVQTDAGVVIMSDNPEYPARLIAPDQQPTVLGVPVGYTRIYGQ